MSTSGSIGWLDITSSIFCAFLSSYLQQRISGVTVSALMSQGFLLRQLKRHGTLSLFLAFDCTADVELTVEAFENDIHDENMSQLWYITGTIIGELKKEYIFHTFFRASHRYRRFVMTTAVAAIMATSATIDEVAVIKNAICGPYGATVSIAIFVDSKKMFHSLVSQRHPMVKSVRGEVSTIRFHNETKVKTSSWIRRSCSLSDYGTKRNSLLADNTSLWLRLQQACYSSISQMPRVENLRNLSDNILQRRRIWIRIRSWNCMYLLVVKYSSS